MKLNKQGWGLSEMLVISGILLILLLIASYYVYTLYTVLDKQSYGSLEIEVLKAAKEYDKDYHFTNYVTVNKLQNKNYLNGLFDYENEKCTGYVKKESSILKAYINCKNYQTLGYNSKYDQ